MSLSALSYVVNNAASTGLKQPQKAAGGTGSFVDLLANSSAQTATPAAKNTDSASTTPGNGAAQIADFRSWKVDYERKVYQDRIDELNQYSNAFEQVLQKADANNGYADPKSFVASLSTDELAALQHVHSLADPINPDALSQEGALNLLQAPGNARDLNHDGMQEVGIARTLQFPPPDAPESVKQAWKETTKNMDDGEAMTLQLMMLTSNAQLPTNGSGEVKFNYMDASTDYVSLAKQVIEGLKFSKAHAPLYQQAHADLMIDGASRFLENLGRV